MDPDTGDIECMLPVEDFSKVIQESDSAWRVATAFDESKLYAASSYVYTLVDVGTEFDASFEASLAQHIALKHERPTS